MSTDAIKVAKRFLGFVPVGDPQCEAERGQHRIWRINLTAVASIGFRGAMFLSSFIYIPLTVRYLGPERYGLWVAITSIMTLLAFADFGIGYGLMNEVAYAIGHGARDSVRKSISSTFFVLFIVALLGCFLFAVAYPLIPWQLVFRTQTQFDAAEASTAVAAIVISFLATLPFTTVQRVQAAYQEGFETQLWEVAGVVLTLAGLLIAIHLRAGIAALAIILSVGPLLAVVLNWLVYFLVRRPLERPVFRLVDFRMTRHIVHQGSYFLILQVASIVIFSIDTFVILHYFGQAALGKYNLVAKLFQVAPALAAVWFAPLWPAYADAIARGDHAWVRRMLHRSTLAGSVGCAIVSCIVALFARPAIHVWTGADVNPSVWLLVGFVIYSTILVGSGAVAAYLNGSNFIKGQALLVIVSALLNITLKIGLCKYGGISGAIWGTNLSFLLFVIPTYCVVVPRLIRQQTRAA